MSDSDTSDSKERELQDISVGTRELVLHVLQTCFAEKNAGLFTFPVNELQERILYYTAMPLETLREIQEEEEDSKATTSKESQWNRYKVFKINDFDRSLIHQCIQEIYESTQGNISIQSFLKEIQEKIYFPWSSKNCRILAKEVGLTWQTIDRRRVLTETPELIAARNKYLEDIQQYRQQGRKIFFLLVTNLFNHLKLKRKNAKVSVQDDSCTRNKLILVHSGSRCRFLNGKTLLYIYKSCRNDEDESAYRNPIIENWLNEELIPNLPPKSVIIADIPTHCKQKDLITSVDAPKWKLVEWLEERNLEYPPKATDAELYILVMALKSKFEIEGIIENHGHEVMNLPVYVYDLNPIEVAWARMKLIVAEYTDSDLSQKGFYKIADLVVNTVQQIAVESDEESENITIKEETSDNLETANCTEEITYGEIISLLRNRSSASEINDEDIRNLTSVIDIKTESEGAS